MAKSVKQLIGAANVAVPRITPAEAREMIAKGNTLVVDVRDAPELDKSGKVAGAVHHSRGMLEFRADPASPYYDKRFETAKTIVVYCASGGRSALAGKVLKEMGYNQVFNMGAFKDWAKTVVQSTNRSTWACHELPSSKRFCADSAQAEAFNRSLMFRLLATAPSRYRSELTV
jgi:rhodanese-related sulfurtransferase